MTKRKFFTVGLDLPGDEFEYVEFESDQTLLDADIILFEPSLGSYDAREQYNGRPLLTPSASFGVKSYLDHWRSEINTAISAGKLVIIYLARPIECYRYTGQKEHSGTGRSRVTTNIVTPVSSYEAVPMLTGVTVTSGKEIRLESGAVYLAPYWSEFAAYSPYEVELTPAPENVLLRSRTGNKVVGAAVHAASGHALFLPPLRYAEEKFVRYDGRSKKSVWTDEALRFGKRLAATLVALSGTLNQSTQTTPPPSWTSGLQYRLAAEGELESRISAVAADIARLQVMKSTLEGNLREAGSLRRLLYEQGKPLESAIIDALGLLGFRAEPFSNSESEFDVVFTSPEGRCLGEAEGKDSRTINIDKFSQLERNLQEDFARDDVTQYAKGVLFGNAHRLAPVAERQEFFTEKCFSAAKRVGVALVRTPDLFLPAKYLKENPSDAEYAKQCREAIFRAQGEIARFPEPPVADTPLLSESG